MNAAHAEQFRCLGRWLARVARHATGLLAVLTVGSTWSLAQVPVARTADEELKTAVQRARSCVFKVECLDQHGSSVPAVLSAVAIDDEGFLITVGLRSPGERKLCVRDCTGKRYEARWIATDEATGLTLLRVQPGVVRSPTMIRGLPEIGAVAIVVGNPFGLSHSVSVGNISGLDRSVSLASGVGRGLIQFTAPVFPGDSGGILADRHGQMVGIVSTVLGEPGAENAADHRVSGIGFAIPAVELRMVAQRLREGGRVERGYLGMTAEDVEPTGVRVTSVAEGSPAEVAGFRMGDVIFAQDDVEVRDFEDLAGRIEQLSPGVEVKLSLKRDGEQLTLMAKLAERKPSQRATSRDPSDSWLERFDIGVGPRTLWDGEQFKRWPNLFAPDGVLLGVLTRPVTETQAKSLGLASTDGALVSSVIASSPAERAGLRLSDVIIEINDEPVKSPQQLQERIQRSGPGAKIKLGVVSDGGKKQVQITLAQPASRPEFGNWPIWSRAPRSSFRDEQGSPRIEALEERMRALEEKLEELEKRLQSKTEEAPSARDKR